jgi:hypothetical protein
VKVVPTHLYGTNDPELYLWFLRDGDVKLWEKVSGGTRRRQAGPGHKRGTKLKELKRSGIPRSELYLPDGPIHPAKVGYLIEKIGRRKLKNLRVSAFGIWCWLKSDAGVEQIVDAGLALPRFVQKHWPGSACSYVKKRHRAAVRVIRPQRRGRPSRESHDDSKLLKEMGALLRANEASTITAAARCVSRDHPGYNAAATIRRLQRKFAASQRKLRE